jgi:hypothetical protein
LALALPLLGGSIARAQETDSQSVTNMATAAEEQSATTETDQTDATTTESAATTELAATNSATPEPAVSRTSAGTQPSGRESRARRLRNRPGRFGGSSNSSASETGGSATNRGPASLEYAAFETIARKNIFDPNRRPNMPFGSRNTNRAPRIDSFSLVGTMTYEKGTFAFFNGSSSQYQKALQAAGEIAGYKITAVTANAVKLAQGTNEFELRVGNQLRREDEGPWALSTATASYGAGSSSSRTPSIGAPSAAPIAGAPPSGPQSEILKRMMQRREQE